MERLLSGAEIARFSPKYYEHGWKGEDIDVENICVVKNKLTATIKVKQLFFDNRIDIPPHFPTIQAFKWGFHLAALYIRWDGAAMGHPLGSIVVREANIKCSHFVANRSFPVCVQVLKSRKITNGEFYRFKIGFDDERLCIVGTAIYQWKL